MTGIIGRWWPRSLAVRLTLMLVVTLAVAQLCLTLLLSRERDSVVEELMHSQALTQAVTLARLVNVADAVETDTLLQAFRSRRSCVAIEASPGSTPMSAQDQQLAEVLQAMLHGIQAGPPRVTLGSIGDDQPDCGGFSLGRADGDADSDGDGDDRAGGDKMAALKMEVPLLDGRWLVVQTPVELPEDSNGLAIVSFLVSAIAVGLVTVWAVRSQTRLLRSLAVASERFGRGEKVEPLPVEGPAEVTAATRAFNIMQQRLSQFIAERMQLLAGISHDLRTPLTTLRLKAELLDDEASRDDLITTIDELSRISEATLAFTQAEAVSEDTVTVNLSELVNEVISDFQLAGKNVSAVRLELVETPCRPIALKRAVRNLVENAVRYGNLARLSIYRDGDNAVIEVVDDGPGIPDHQIVEAFKPFVRLEPSRNTETGGIGLGLSIAQGIVHAHGGTLTLSSIGNSQGLRATIHLPAGRMS